MYSYVTAHVPLPLVYDDGESLLYAKRSGKPLVLLAGHTDTVPAQGNIPGRIEDGAVHGLGSTDMKGGLAVMIELARWAADADLAYDLGLLFFPREEVGPDDNPLPGLFAATPVIDEAALVICLEPTDNTLQLGCLGNLNARVVFEGRAAHSARPGSASTPSSSRSKGSRDVLELEPRDVEVQGLVFREVLSVTQIHGGIATNVIPARVDCTLNFRYAPDRTPESAEERVRELSGATSRSCRTRRRRGSPSTRRSSSGCGSRAFEVSRSRRGRTSPTSRRAGSTRSTSAPARRDTRTRPTSRSRSPSSSGRTRRCSGSCFRRLATRTSAQPDRGDLRCVAHPPRQTSRRIRRLAACAAWQRWRASGPVCTAKGGEHHEGLSSRLRVAGRRRPRLGSDVVGSGVGPEFGGPATRERPCARRLDGA